jgi:transposase
MRGEDQESQGFFSYVRLEQRVPTDHPLRPIRELVASALTELSRDFDKIYARDGRPSIPPERLLRALLLQAFYTIRSERQLMEQLDYNLLFRWFVGLSMDDPVWDPTVFSKNRDRLLDGCSRPSTSRWMGTLIEAWASMKSFVPKGGGDPPTGKGRRVLRTSGRFKTAAKNLAATSPLCTFPREQWSYYEERRFGPLHSQRHQARAGPDDQCSPIQTYRSIPVPFQASG